MLPRHDRVVKLEIVQSSRWILEVKLHQVNSVSERVERHVPTLSDGDIFVSFLIDSMAGVDGNWLDFGLDCVLLAKIINCDARDLHVE